MKWTRRQIFRVALHFPVGVLNGFATEVNIAIGLIICLSFLFYEVTEDWRIKDNAYVDIMGYLFGLAAFVLLRLSGICE